MIMLAIFVLTVLLLAYIAAGYLLFLRALVGVLAKPVARDDAYRPAVEIVLIVHNEGRLVARKLANLLSLDYPQERLAITVVSDGSTDDTCAQVRALADARIRLIERPVKTSKAACLNLAVAQAQAPVLLLTDARQTLAPDALTHLVAPLADPAVGAVSGALGFQAEGHNAFSKGIEAYWDVEKEIRKHEAMIDSAVGVTGAIYAFRRSAYQPIPDETLLDDVLVPMQMVLAGYRVLFEERARAFDIPSSDEARERRRKTRTIAGNLQLVALAPALMNPWRNRIWWQFVSHKMLRLAAPLLLAGIAVSSIALAFQHDAFILLVAAQLLLYGLVWASTRLPWLQQNRLLRAGRAFMSLAYFTVLGMWTFANRQHLSSWK